MPAIRKITVPTDLFANLDIQTKDTAALILQDGSLPIVNKVSVNSSFLSSYCLTIAATATTSVSN